MNNMSEKKETEYTFCWKNDDESGTRGCAKFTGSDNFAIGAAIALINNTVEVHELKFSPAIPVFDDEEPVEEEFSKYCYNSEDDPIVISKQNPGTYIVSEIDDIEEHKIIYKFNKEMIEGFLYSESKMVGPSTTYKRKIYLDGVLAEKK